MSEKILKLDELVGKANPIIVERLGKRYEMVRPEGLTLKQNNEWQATANKLLRFYGPEAKKKDSEKINMFELGKAVNDCIRMLCPSILDEDKPLSLMEKINRKLHPDDFEARKPFSFDEKVKVLEFYIQEVFEKSGSSPSRKDRSGAQNSRKNRTGA